MSHEDTEHKANVPLGGAMPTALLISPNEQPSFCQEVLPISADMQFCEGCVHF
jgi:hypothetical protein